MFTRFNHFLDNASNFLAVRKGLLPMIGILLIIVNAILQFFPEAGFLARTNLLLHIGIIIAILGVMLAWAL
ncbi:MAG: hypothetical protein ACM3PY_22350 [Omnitrophica WOR_2 bacterium]